MTSIPAVPAAPSGSLPRPWLTSYEPGVPQDLAPSSRTLYRLLEDAATRYPNREALQFLGQGTTFRELLKRVRRFAKALQRSGVQQGDRVAIMLPNCPQFVVAFYGTLLAGAVVVNTSPLYTAAELEHQLSDSGSETLVILDSLYPRYAEVADKVPVKRVLVSRIQDELPFPKNLLFPIKALKEGTLASDSFKRNPRAVPMRFVTKLQDPDPVSVPITADDVALLQYTGGTTGVPKGAMLTHRNLVANAEQCRSWMVGLQEGREITMAAIPFFHVYGMTVAMNLSMLIGATLVLVPNARDIKMVLDEISRTRATIFPGVPTLYNAINNHPATAAHDLTTIRACISGSAPLMQDTARTFREITQGANLVEGYGLTETSPVTHVNPITGEQKEGSIGLPLPGVDALIMDDAGQPVPTGEVGELWVAGPMVMKGYWNMPDETAKVLREYAGKTWLLTGDMATMDEQGFFRIVDRKKELIIAGGHNIYPREVEEVLTSHPAVLEAAAVGLPDPYRGETVHAVVALKPGMQATEKEIIAYCRTLLSAYKAPRSVEFRDELPKTAVGKTLRRQLAAEARERLKKEKAEKSA